ncbi:hypothetical protein V9T40_012398 [Parthenolecanium corni]|uniref:Uncharacterized protein n=1 Tax=Parthenolecanium corni TaxID=536013 RepID=A0AAN9T751_9HEMI
MASSSASNISTVAEEFEKLEMEVAEVLSTEPSGEVLGMDTTEPSTPKTPSTELVVSEVQNVIQKQSILIPPRKDDPNRVFKRKKVEIELFPVTFLLASEQTNCLPGKASEQLPGIFRPVLAQDYQS